MDSHMGKFLDASLHLYKRVCLSVRQGNLTGVQAKKAGVLEAEAGFLKAEAGYLKMDGFPVLKDGFLGS